MRLLAAALLSLAFLACSGEAPETETETAEAPAAPVKTPRTFFHPDGFRDGTPYSPGVMAGDTLWIAGMVGSNPATGEKAGDIGAQTRQAMGNVGLVLKDAGLTYSNLVSCHVQLTDMENYQAMNSEYGSFFEEGKYPARTTLEMPGLVGGNEIEISCIAYAETDEIEYVKPDPNVIPPAMGPYSSAVRAGKMLYLSGQGGRNPQTGEVAEDVAEQTRQTMETIGHILAAADLTHENAVFTNVYYLGPENRAAVDGAYMERFQPGAAPSRGAFCLSRLPGTISAEITFVAADDDYITRLHPADAAADPTESPASLSQGILYLTAAAAPGATIEEQFRGIMDKQIARLELAEMGLANVVNANVYLSDTADFDAMNAVFREYFPEGKPARTTVAVREEGDRSDIKLEIAFIAVE